MEILNKNIKHYINYSIDCLSNEERNELYKIIKNESVLNPFARSITKQNEQVNSKWLVSMIATTNDLSIKLILK